jgi:4-hydroxythreonine-4-phosphate dehydrogenase
MPTQPRLAISIGDLNGIGIEIALRSHTQVATLADPIYCIDQAMLEQAAHKLGLPIPSDLRTIHTETAKFEIRPGMIDPKSGAYSYGSFVRAIELARDEEVDAIVTLPIHKKAWELAGIRHKGHTDALRDLFDQDAIMMLGCEAMYVALYTEHIPLHQVAESLTLQNLTRFLLDFYHAVKPSRPIGVLGLNPHAGDGGVLGDEERIIEAAIKTANDTLGQEVFKGPLVPDVAFTPHIRQRFKHYVAMYHDQGLAPLKALYFDESINVSLHLPILRTSVDHGTAFDIAYSGATPNCQSYLNAISYALGHSRH